MIILHQYPKAFGLSSLSPFCMKVEMFLQRAQLPYSLKVEVNPRRGPNGKMPFIEDGYKIIPDSSFIIDYLINEYNLQRLQIEDPKTRSYAEAVKSMVEEGLYFILLYSRWVDDDGYRVIEQNFKSLFPFYSGKICLRLIRRSLKHQAYAQGIGRLSKDEVYKIGVNQMKALGNILGSQEYFFEDRFTLYDCTIYSFLETIYQQRIESPVYYALMAEENLCRYLERFRR